MTGFRFFLATIFSVIMIYTVIVIANHGLGFLPVFIADILEMGWPGQFNLDFLGFLFLSVLWVAWRHNFSIKGIALSMLALLFGMPFLALYLLFLSFHTNGDILRMIVGNPEVILQRNESVKN